AKAAAPSAPIGIGQPAFSAAAAPAAVASVPAFLPEPPKVAEGADDPTRAALAARLAGVIARAAGRDVSDLVISAGQPLWIRSADGFAAASAAPIGEAELGAFVD